MNHHTADKPAPSAPTHADAVLDTAPVDLAVSTDPRSQAAFNAVLDAARAIPRDELVPVNLDLPTTGTTCVAVARRLAPHRSFFELLPGFDMKNFDGLEASGLALLVAQADYRAAVTPPDSLPDLVAKGTDMRNGLQLWGDALAHAGVISPATADAIRGGAGYKDLAVGIMSWVRAYRAADWERIKRTTMLTDETLVEAESIAQRIYATVGYRDLNPEKVAAVAEIRQRILTVAVRRYDQVRRGATYLRWSEGDVDSFAPSLFAKGPRRPAQDDKHDTPASNATAAPGAPSTPGANPATPAAPPSAPAAQPASSPASQEVGMPNSRPFLTR